MPTDLVLASVGSGKTEAAVEVLINTTIERPFAPIWVLLPTRRQEDAFRQRLAERGRRVRFNIHFFNFYSLYTRLLDMAGQPQRQLDETARLHLLRQILTNLEINRSLEVFDKIAHTPGFVEVAARFIYELKQNIIFPEVFAQAGRSLKDWDLAAIYNEYQNTLQQNFLVDREGEGWVALEAVGNQSDIATDVALLVVDGFDQLNPLQARLLALLASRTQKTLVTLPTVVGRESTVGRRFVEAYQHLRTEYEATGQSFRIVSTSSIASPFGSQELRRPLRHPALRYLTEKSFLADVEPRPSDNALRLIEAPDVRQEVAAVLRHVKSLLLAGNCQPDDILIAVRDWGPYGELIASASHRYGIPVALHFGEPLANNPAIIALLNLLELAENDFRRRDLLDILRSPYFAVEGLDSANVDLLERVSQSQLVIGGREAWMEAIEQAAIVIPSDEDEPQKPLLSNLESEHLIGHMTAFFEVVTPPLTASVTEYIRWLERLIGADTEIDLDEGDDFKPDVIPDAERVLSIHALRQIRQPSDIAEIVDRDLIAMRGFKGVLRSMFAAQNLFAALDFEHSETTNWGTFIRDLKTAVGSTPINRSQSRSGRVLVTAVADGRGLPHKHVFIPGLSEGIFPAPIPEDPLYLDTERRALAQAGIPLETQAERAADEGLFYELISLAHESLTLSRPAIQNGSLWPESHLWRMVAELFSDSEQIIQRDRIALGSVITPSEVASHSEAALAVASHLNLPEWSWETQPLYNWLVSTKRAYWLHIQSARQIELHRMTTGNLDRYSGGLSHPALLAWLAEELGSRRVWSASQFNDYGMCGFRFFSKRLLKLEKVREPEEGMDAAQLGTLNHAILEKTYGRLAELGVTITPDNVGQAISILREVAVQVLRDAPRSIGFRQSALWQQEQITLLRKLEALMRVDFSDENPMAKQVKGEIRQPYRQEIPFSPGANNVIELDAISGLKVTGYIDRMDRVGDRVIVIDYKTGSTVIPTKEMQRGRNFQMMLYLLAGQVVLDNEPDPNAPQEVTGGLFWHLRNQQSSGTISLDKDEDREAIQEGLEHLTRQIQLGRSGAFSAQPNKVEQSACSHYCEFNQFCRVSIMNRKRSGG